MSSIEIIRQNWQLDQFVSESLLSTWEQETGYTLPADYRTFLLKYNGGVIRPWLFRHNHPELDKDEQEMILDYLHAWNKVLDYSELDVPTHLMTQPPGYLVIGQDPGGNAIMLSLQAETQGNIVYWLRTYSEWGDEFNNTLGFIAPSFATFLNGLYDDGETEHGYWDVLTRKRQAIPLIL